MYFLLHFFDPLIKNSNFLLVFETLRCAAEHCLTAGSITFRYSDRIIFCLRHFFSGQHFCAQIPAFHCLIYFFTSYQMRGIDKSLSTTEHVLISRIITFWYKSIGHKKTIDKENWGCGRQRGTRREWARQRAQIYNKLITLTDNVSISLCKGPRECVLRKTHADVGYGVALRKKERRVVCKFLCTWCVCVFIVNRTLPATTHSRRKTIFKRSVIACERYNVQIGAARAFRIPMPFYPPVYVISFS